MKPDRSLLIPGLAVLACVCVGALVYRATLDTQLSRQQHAAAQRLDFAGQSLESLLHRNEALPALLALDDGLGHALRDSGPAGLAAANAFLEQAAGLADVEAAYLMDAGGHTVAASNWRQPGSFMGQNYRFRPYFEAAMQGRTGRFYGVGATTGKPGYFIAAPLPAEAPARGVVAVKISLDTFEAALAAGGDTVLLADRDGVVFLSTEAEWRYRTLTPLGGEALVRLQSAQQYGSHALRPLDHGLGAWPDGRTPVRLRRAGQERDFTVAARGVGPLGWQMLLLADQTPARQESLVAGLAGALCAALLLGLALYQRLDRQGQAERRASAERLQTARDMLETQITQRTADLTAANAALQDRVRDLQHAEQILRGTRDAAVQAGKLAVLGQMAAGMSHELNQPLAALQTLSDNAIALDRQGRREDVTENLHLIGQLAARMGRIVRQLKSFVRKEAPVLRACSVRDALDHALMLLAPRCTAVRVRIDVQEFSPGLCVRADATRLEQVLVNLLRNGLDAVQDRPVREVRFACAVEAQGSGGTVRLRVSDTGGGIAPEARERLFEPFFTTKAGEGLGLGLAVSRIIVEGMGGTLAAADLPQGGAEFTVALPLAHPDT
ncbi:sensor histidine kinase [Paracidovorax cattleyae]|uniref:C4-dicarboxylate transport sensor protein DctB n=3 Tax=Paracidovorax cattleyae TaxID=80868 RepID=A0A1H0WM16_9BURK|nr:ATP-binding protein [Paracidovorax cattleyae]AVS72800.1 sensor histidine kinase [Paracidovorax cattleyae]SDP91585.1 two-component system, NtrC family, C4-dicarboxylate transport sensor histidine kinase DctB [Paracidovorax cattleyae]